MKIRYIKNKLSVLIVLALLSGGFDSMEMKAAVSGDSSEISDLPPASGEPLVSEEPAASETPIISASPAASEEPVASQSPNSGKKKKKKTIKQGKWKEKAQVYYYIYKKKKAKGLTKIGRRTFYFDKKGIQRTGWQKIKENYYFFKIANKEKGCMVVSKKVNRIQLDKNGRAKLNAKNKKRLDVLWKANKIVEKAVKPDMKPEVKRKKIFQYAIKHFRYSGSLLFNKNKAWELDYALDMFDKGHGNCFAYGAAFAFLANAIGDSKCYAVSSGGHGWSEIDGKVYDLSWHITDKKHSYYGMSYGLSGVGGRPNFKAGRKYLARI